MDYSKEMIKENLLILHEKISLAEKKSGRKPESVKLQAVSKFHPFTSVLGAMECGQILFGENRIQEAVQKFIQVQTVSNRYELHIIGSLQRNKVKHAVKIATCIESVDRIELLAEIEKQCAEINKSIAVLFEFHTGEESKSGFGTIEALDGALRYCAEGNAPHVIPKGFMTMAPFTDDESAVRASFALMRNTADLMKKNYPQFDLSELSMGMSGDFEIAIEEGSTQVRIGTAIFGERDYSAK